MVSYHFVSFRRENVASNARRLKIFFECVRDDCGGALPRNGDTVKLAHWDDDKTGKRKDHVGIRWYHLTREENDERRHRLKHYDDASKNALEYLKTCQPRTAKD